MEAIMSQILDLKCSPNDGQIPTVILTKLMLRDAVNKEADYLIFELDLQLHTKAEAEHDKMRKNGDYSNYEFPEVFHITFKKDGNESKKPSAPSNLFDLIVRVLLNVVEVPYWKKGEISAELETGNPSSKWIIESKDLTQRIQLRRIRAT